MKKRDIVGLHVVAANTNNLLDQMVEDCRAGHPPKVVVDINGEAISKYHADADYRLAYDSANLSHADGMSVVWLSNILSGPKIPERTATTDYIHAAADRASSEGLIFYLLGGPEEINATCEKRLRELYPNLRIAGRRNGYFPDDEIDAVINEINESGADIVWIGMGKPKETVLAVKLRDHVTASWLITCGGCFHFIAGDYKRAPVWMQSAGLEWLFRVATGPRYLIKRYFVTIFHVFWLLFQREVLRRKKYPTGKSQ